MLLLRSQGLSFAGRRLAAPAHGPVPMERGSARYERDEYKFPHSFELMPPAPRLSRMAIGLQDLLAANVEIKVGCIVSHLLRIKVVFMYLYTVKWL